MPEPHTNKHWTRATVSLGLPIILFVLFFIAVAVQPNAEPSLSRYPLVSTIGYSFIITLFLWPIPCGYFVSQDKEILSKTLPDTNTRHWFVTIALSYFSAGIYPLWYILYRKYTIDASDTISDDVVDREIASSNQAAPSARVVGEDPHTLAENARGSSVTAERLTSTGSAIISGSFLHDQPMINYLDEQEHPHYHFDNIKKGLNSKNKKIRVGWSGDYRASMLITTDGVHFFVGQSGSDFHKFVDYESISDVQNEYSYFSRNGKFILITDDNKYEFWIDPKNVLRKYNTEEIQNAKKYIKEQIETHETTRDYTEDTDSHIETVSDGQVSPSNSESASDDETTDEASQPNEERSDNAELADTVKESVQEGDKLQHSSDEYADDGEFEQALKTNAEAQRVYEDALETATETDLVDSEEIEQKLTAIQDHREEIYRRRLQTNVDSLRSDVSHAVELADDGEFEAAKQQLLDLESALTSAKQMATKHGLDDLQNEIETIDQRRQECINELNNELSMTVPDDIPGSPTISVDYDELSEEGTIGGGGNADVTKATLSSSGTGVTLAIKEPRMGGTLHTDQVERMLQEAETWDRLDAHDHIVGVVDYDSDPLPWIAMEYMDGGHLGDRSGEMTLPQALWTATVVTKGVRHAHGKGVAHLDLKPANILFRTIEESWDVPKVADWGLSKHLLDHSNSVEGLSPQYAAPEQFDDEYGATDDVTDIYQLGAVFYELFTGQPPFDGKPFKIIRKIQDESPTPPSNLVDVPEEVDENIPDKLDDILLAALAKRKHDRYEDIIYFRDDLQELFDSVTEEIGWETTGGSTNGKTGNDDSSDGNSNTSSTDDNSDDTSSDEAFPAYERIEPTEIEPGQEVRYLVKTVHQNTTSAPYEGTLTVSEVDKEGDTKNDRIIVYFEYGQDEHGVSTRRAVYDNDSDIDPEYQKARLSAGKIDHWRKFGTEGGLDLFHPVVDSDDHNDGNGDSTGTDDLPVSEEVHEDLVTVVETAPNRAWINQYFDWLATLLNATDLDKHDDRLVTSIKTDQKSLPVTISWRYCLKGFPSESKVAAILPADSAAIDELEADATYTERFSGNSGAEPYYYQLPASAGDFFIEEYEEDWLRAVQEQCDIDRNARNPGAHKPAVCIAALDSVYRERVLDEAF